MSLAENMSATVDNTDDADSTDDQISACGHASKADDANEKTLNGGLRAFKDHCEHCYDDPPEIGATVIVCPTRQKYHKPAGGSA